MKANSYIYWAKAPSDQKSESNHDKLIPDPKAAIVVRNL